MRAIYGMISGVSKYPPTLAKLDGALALPGFSTTVVILISPSAWTVPATIP
jgi:hypothetical protein